jgi:alkanesulfonate monooxygenase SsuD/methylene tetrahydromethanopterin reductase-like flavin-dependent oxidoreductase (luciferase family)
VWAWTQDDYRERLAVLARACERAGRDPALVTRSLGLYTLVGEDDADLRRRFRRMQERSLPGVLAGADLDEWRTGRLVGTVEEVREQLAGWEALGVGSLVVCLAPVPFSVVSADDVDLVAQACSLVAR